MTEDIKKREQSVQGSISDLANRRGESLELTMAQADVIVYFDHSGSMNSSMSDGRTKWEHAVDQLKLVQKDHEGRVILFSFSENAVWSQGGMPPPPEASTNLRKALDMGEPFDGTGIIHIVISDGAPTDSREMSLKKTAKWKDPIHTIYIGPEHGAGRRFMEQLANNGGTSLANKSPDLIASHISGLIGEGKEES